MTDQSDDGDYDDYACNDKDKMVTMTKMVMKTVVGSGAGQWRVSGVDAPLSNTPTL